MRFLPKKRVVVMDLVDLEHCGFDVEEFHSELFLHGIDDVEATFPLALVVNFAGGHVLTPKTSQETVDALKQQRRQFAELFAGIFEEDDAHDPH